jgi:hypothetical protein
LLRVVIDNFLESKPYNAFKADMFSFGLVAHHIISGRTFEKGQPNCVMFSRADMEADRLPLLVAPGCADEEQTGQKFAKGAELRRCLLRHEPSNRISAADAVNFLLGRGSADAHPISIFCRDHGLGLVWDTHSLNLCEKKLHELMVMSIEELVALLGGESAPAEKFFEELENEQLVCCCEELWMNHDEG